jgi:pimeloyl-ACP methyl ester carboxylesterase
MKDELKETVRLSYTDEGAGEPIVLLHGYPFNRTMWRGQVAALRERYRVITPDLRGLGATPMADTATMAEMARDVVALLDKLKIEKAVIGGLSMGGYVVLELARLFPERVSGLILADTRAQADTDELRAGRQAHAQAVLGGGMAAIVDDFLPKMLAPRTFVAQPEIAAQVRAMILATKPEGAAAAQRGMAQRRDHLAWLPQVSVPVLVLVGTEDAVTPPADAEAMHAALPDARLVVLEGAGHVSNLEQPDAFNTALFYFLSLKRK